MEHPIYYAVQKQRAGDSYRYFIIEKTDGAIPRGVFIQRFVFNLQKQPNGLRDWVDGIKNVDFITKEDIKELRKTCPVIPVTEAI